MESFNSRLKRLLRTDRVSTPNFGSSQINVGTNERIVSASAGGLLMWYGLRKFSVPRILTALGGAFLVYRGATAYCPVNEFIGRDTAGGDGKTINLSSSLIINKPRKELYDYWRNLENLPNFMKHLEEVTQTGINQSRWKASAFGDMASIEWNAQITDEIENEMIAWRSLPGSEINNAGEVRFKDIPSNNSTLVQTFISYRAPEGEVGTNVAKLLNPLFKKMVREDLNRFKKLMETDIKISSDNENTVEV